MTDGDRPPFDERRFFQELEGHMDRSFGGLRAELREDMRRSTDRSFQEHEKTRKHVAAVTAMVRTMWEHIFGKGTPPPTGSGELAFSLTEPKTDPSRPDGPKTLPQQVSEHDATLASIQGQLLGLDGRTTEAVAEIRAEVQAKVGAVESKVDTLVDLQKRQMGMRDEDDRSLLRRVGDGFVWLLTDRAGRKFALTLIAAISGLATSCGTMYALGSGRLPMPNAPSPPAMHAPP